MSKRIVIKIEVNEVQLRSQMNKDSDVPFDEVVEALRLDLNRRLNEGAHLKNDFKIIDKDFIKDKDFPLEISESDKLGDKKFNHPSIGKIKVMRPRGRVDLVCSSIDVDQFIEIEIEHAELTHNYGSDHLFGKNLITKVWMTPAQWANLVSSVGDYEGSPCTIRWTQDHGGIKLTNFKEMVPDPTKQMIDKYSDEAYERMDKLLSVLKEQAKNTKVPASVRKELESSIRSLEQQLTSSFNFSMEQLQEVKEKTLTAQKREFDAFIQNKIFSIGVEHLRTNGVKDIPKNFISSVPSSVIEEEGNHVQ